MSLVGAVPMLFGGRSSLLDGLVAFWKLDGDGVDAVGGHDMVPSGITWGAGKIGQAATAFNGGANSMVCGPTDLNVTGDLTIAGWIYPTTSSNYYTILLHGDAGAAVNTNYHLLHVSGGVGLYGKNNGNVSSAGGILTMNQWQFLAATRLSNGLTRLVRNLTFVAGSTGPVPNSVPTKSTRIGCREDNYSLFQGSIDAWGVWSRILTGYDGTSTVAAGSELDQLYNAGVGKQHPFS